MSRGPIGPRRSCLSHCTACDSHFAGDGAFDAHRRGGRCIDPEDVTNREGERVLALKTDDGTCALLSPPETVSGVVVWQLAASQGFSGFTSTREARSA